VKRAARAIRFVLAYARAHFVSYIIGLIMMIATGAIVVRIPELIGQAINVIEDGQVDAVEVARAVALEIAVLALALVVTRTLARVLYFNPGRDIQFAIMRDLFGRLLTLQRPFFAKHKMGELISISANDTQSVRLLVGFAGFQVLNVAVLVPMHLWKMWETDRVLTLWCALPILLGAVAMRQVIQRFYSLVRGSMEVLAGLSDRILESYSGVATIRAYGVEDAATERFQRRNQAYLDVVLKLARIRAFGMPVLQFSAMVATVLVIWIGGDRVIDGEMRVGHLVTFMSLLAGMTGALTALAWVMAAVSKGAVALDRVQGLIESEDGVVREGRVLDLHGPPRLELRNLSYTYLGADKPALKSVSVSVAPGAVLGIFGRTGSGKSTLVDLISRVQDPPAGSVMLDGMAIESLDLASFRACLAVVPQTPFLFSTTIANNIRMRDEASGHLASEDGIRADESPGASASSDDSEGALADDDVRLKQVVSAACLDSDLKQLADGLETVVGERGVILSGGQRQRSVLARALFRRPKILLLDDVLSAVDQVTETKLVASIRALDGGDGLGPTTVIVSHRTSVLEHADEIIVLEHGEVVERGTHAELVASGSHYAEIHEHQREADLA